MACMVASRTQGEKENVELSVSIIGLFSLDKVKSVLRKRLLSIIFSSPAQRSRVLLTFVFACMAAARCLR